MLYVGRVLPFPAASQERRIVSPLSSAFTTSPWTGSPTVAYADQSGPLSDFFSSVGFLSSGFFSSSATARAVSPRPRTATAANRTRNRDMRGPPGEGRDIRLDP